MKINGQFVTPVSPASLLALRDGPSSWAAVGSLSDVRRDDAGVFRAVFTPPHAVVPIPLLLTITVQRAAAGGALLHVHGRRGPHAVDVALTVDSAMSWAALQARGFPGPPTSPSGGLPRASGSGWPATSRLRPSAMSFIRPQQPPEPHHSRRRPPVGGIDLHAHLAPRIDPSSHGLRGIGTAEDGRLTEDGSPLGPVPLYRPELLTAYLDRADLDQAVVSIPPPFFRQDQPSDDAARWARAVNDGILAAVAAHPRLLPLAYLPLEYPEVAVAEYRTLREDARFVGVVGAAGGRSVSLADNRFSELWKLMDDDRKLLLLHPGVSPDDRLTPFYLQNLLGNPVETAVATAELVFGDVLARHPGLRVLLVHCGGCVPAVAGRWQHGVATGRPGLRALSESPEQALRRIYVDCLAHDPPLVDHAITVFGEDKLVLGSDWPFPMGTNDPRALVTHRGDEFAERVAEHNARNLLG